MQAGKPARRLPICNNSGWPLPDSFSLMRLTAIVRACVVECGVSGCGSSSDGVKVFCWSSVLARERSAPCLFAHLFSLIVFFSPFLASSLFSALLSGGQCWTEMDARTGRCNSLLSLDTSREECCSSAAGSGSSGSGGGGGGAFAAYSSRDYKPGEIFFFRAFRGGVPCEPCQSKLQQQLGQE